MPYEKWIDSNNPTCLIFTIDQSDSMGDPFAGEPGRSKAQRLADAVNRLLQEIVIRCTRGEVVKNYFQVGLIGYGGQVGPAWGKKVNANDDDTLARANKDVVWVSELYDHPVRMESRTRKADDGAGGLRDETIKLPIWIDPVHNNGTPMGQALERTYDVLSSWVGQYPESYPPMVFNISDGEANGSPDPQEPAQKIRELSTNDGNVLLFNLHLSGTGGTPILYPESDGSLPDKVACELFGMSSQLPPRFLDEARKEGIAVGESSRGFVFQADGVELIKFLDMGTRQLMAAMR